ncbi:MAG: ABC transporter ATP-binding protein [Tissierellia bacterium]|nr:ABC transporter ATP-binding protein [Tissierellia bacterium]
MHNVVVVNNLKKTYSNKIALRDVSFQMPKGRVLGILGPNGSGKTTLIKILAGITHQENGEVMIEGKAPGKETKAMVAYLADRNTMYNSFSIREAINMFKSFYDNFNEDKAEELLKFMKLNPEDKVGTLSKGMKEKLHLLLVLSRDAKLYILDEPIAGVDPVARDQILDAIINSISQDSTLLITTHLVRDMERIFDDVIFISDGSFILTGEADSLRLEKNMSIDELYKAIFS